MFNVDRFVPQFVINVANAYIQVRPSHTSDNERL